jgi:hypothetical protein
MVRKNGLWLVAVAVALGSASVTAQGPAIPGLHEAAVPVHSEPVRTGHGAAGFSADAGWSGPATVPFDGGPLVGPGPGGPPLPPPAVPLGDPLFPYDSQEPWMHGYFQEIPAYGGYLSFRPYNYRHVLSQSQAAGGWGMRPTMPYSHHFWHRYHEQATMEKK